MDLPIKSSIKSHVNGYLIKSTWLVLFDNEL